MTKAFSGHNYSFKVDNFPLSKGQNIFSIISTHQPTKKKSFITNVNVILSELGIHQDRPEFWESEWMLNKKEASNLATLAGRLFSGNKFVPYLENYLDLDRKQSEWENYD